MVKALLHLAIIVALFLVLSRNIPGFHVQGWGVALIAALLLGLVNATLGFVLKLLTLPLVLITFGLFSFVVNAVMLLLVALLVPGFSINGFWPALLASLILAAVNMVWGAATKEREKE
jgi:putative membrane protein